MEKITLNNVPAYGGIAAVDAYIGATETAMPHDTYGGAHVIEDLIAGKDVLLQASAKGTDCYPRTEIKTLINKTQSMSLSCSIHEMPTRIIMWR